jgi:hypothetical protein
MEVVGIIILGSSQRLHCKERTLIQSIGAGMTAIEYALGVQFWTIDGLCLTIPIYLCDTIAISILKFALASRR